MPTDIVLPSGNEAQFCAMAKRLGYTKLVMLYAKKPAPFSSEGIEIKQALLVEVNRISSLRSQALCFYKATGDDRPALEHRPHVSYGFELLNRKDGLHQRNSGLDHVLAAIISKAASAVALSFNTLLIAKPLDRAILMGRMTQNIGICTHAKVRMLMGSFATKPEEMRSPHDLQALCRVLGMTGKQAKAAFSL